MTRPLIALLFLLGLALTPAWSQPAPFTLEAETITVDDQDQRLKIICTGGVRYREGSQSIQAGSGQAVVTRTGNLTELKLEGSVRYEDTTLGHSGHAGDLFWTPGMHTVDLGGGVTLEQTAPSLPLSATATTVQMRTDTGALTAWESVKLEVPDVSGFGANGATLPLSLAGTHATVDAGSGAVVCEGAPAKLVYGDLTLDAPTLTLIVTNQQLASLVTNGAVTLTGDVRGTGIPAVMHATHLEYFPTPPRFEIAGPIDMVQGADTLNAESAIVHLGSQRRIDFVGLQIAARVDPGTE